MGRNEVRDRTVELATTVADPDADHRERTAALGALVRHGHRRAARAAWQALAMDPRPQLRRRAAELMPRLAPMPTAAVIAKLEDTEPLVAETACWAAGEIDWRPTDRAPVVAALVVAARHRDPLVREAAVAALGAIGDPDGLGAILAGCTDRPAIRRRAVLALAPFAGTEVDRALAAALTDADWQTRQAAEDLLEVPPSE